MTLAAGASEIAIAKDAVSYVSADGVRRAADCDTVIVAQGAVGDQTLADALRGEGFAVQVIGDANGVGYIEGAMRGAYEAVEALVG